MVLRATGENLELLAAFADRLFSPRLRFAANFFLLKWSFLIPPSLRNWSPQEAKGLNQAVISFNRKSISRDTCAHSVPSLMRARLPTRSDLIFVMRREWWPRFERVFVRALHAIHVCCFCCRAIVKAISVAAAAKFLLLLLPFWSVFPSSPVNAPQKRKN